MRVLVGRSVGSLTNGIRVPGLPISVGVAGFVLVGVAQGNTFVGEGVRVGVEARGALLLLGVLVGGWKVGALAVGGHDVLGVVSCAFDGL